MSDADQNIAALLSEERVFEPAEAFAARAVVQDRSVYERAEADHEAFWAEQADRLGWVKRWDTVMTWDPPWVKWFEGGQLNAAYNCLDRHVEAGGGDKVAYFWEGEPGEERAITYRELLDEVCRFANALKGLGVRKGDRVAIYLGMIPELPVAMLACARIGAPHSVVFGGFSSEALRDRIIDAEAKVLITADGGYRRGAVVPLKANADEAVQECPTIEHVVTVRRTGGEHAFTEGRDHWYHDLVEGQSTECEPEPMDAEDPLYLLYTSGTTGKPKGIVHTTGGYLTQVAATHRMIFDIHEDDVYWCAADIGWVTGHSYIVYGPLANHTTSIIYEGAPDTGRPRIDWWQIVEKLPGHDPVHGADRYPCIHALGDAVSREARPVVASAARVGRRAHQSGGVGLVLDASSAANAAPSSTPGGRPRRGRSSSPPARHHDAEARLGHASRSRASSRRHRRRRRVRRCRSAAAATWC